jgi:hypothetical protein
VIKRLAGFKQSVRKLNKEQRARGLSWENELFITQVANSDAAGISVQLEPQMADAPSSSSTPDAAQAVVAIAGRLYVHEV